MVVDPQPQHQTTWSVTPSSRSRQPFGKFDRRNTHTDTFNHPRPKTRTGNLFSQQFAGAIFSLNNFSSSPTCFKQTSKHSNPPSQISFKTPPLPGQSLYHDPCAMPTLSLNTLKFGKSWNKLLKPGIQDSSQSPLNTVAISMISSFVMNRPTGFNVSISSNRDGDVRLQNLDGRP